MLPALRLRASARSTPGALRQEKTELPVIEDSEAAVVVRSCLDLMYSSSISSRHDLVTRYKPSGATKTVTVVDSARPFASTRRDIGSSLLGHWFGHGKNLSLIISISGCGQGTAAAVGPDRPGRGPHCDADSDTMTR
jgi:hypothetical protein